MERVNPDRAVRVAQRQKNFSTTSTGDQEVINALFATIKVAYPNFMKNQNQDIGSIKRMWLLHLGGYAREKIEEAAKLMVDRYPTFAPTLGEFKQLIAEINQAKPAHQEYIALPRPEADPNIARTHLDKMRELLR